MNCPKCNKTINPLKGLIKEQIEYIKKSKSDLLMRCEICDTEVSIYKDKITNQIDRIPGKTHLILS
jgi:transcription elongation factor Elf1